MSNRENYAVIRISVHKNLLARAARQVLKRKAPGEQKPTNRLINELVVAALEEKLIKLEAV